MVQRQKKKKAVEKSAFKGNELCLREAGGKEYKKDREDRLHKGNSTYQHNKRKKKKKIRAHHTSQRETSP